MRDEHSLSLLGRLAGTKSLLQVTNAPTYRRCARSFIDSGKYFYIGGKDGGTVYFRTFHQYDILQDAWTQLADYPGLGSYQLIWGQDYSGALFAGGGSDGVTLHKDFWRYDIVAQTWTQMQDIPIASGISSSGCCSAPPYIYLVGGYSAGVGTQSFYRYHTITDSWESLAPCVYPIYGNPAMRWGDEIYCWSGARQGVGYRSDILKYSLITDSWSIVENTLVTLGRIQAAGWAQNGKLYIMGGETNLNDFWEYDILTRQVAQLQSWPSIRLNMPTYAFDPVTQKAYVQAGRLNVSYEIMRVE